MTEILSIFLQIIILNIFFLFPINLNNIKFCFHDKMNSIFDVFILNILVYSVLFLILSFFNLNLFFVFIFSMIASIISVIYNYKVYYKYFIEKNNLKFFIFFLCCLVGISFAIASNPLLTWDGIAHWYYKALNFNQGETYTNLKNLYFSYYPHLGSYIWNFFWTNSILNIEYFGRFFFIFIFLSTIFSATNKLSIKIRFYQKLIITLILVIFINDLFLLGGYQDYFIFYLFYCFALLIFKINDLDKEKIILTFLILATTLLMFWVKQEGFFYTLILAFILIWFLKTSIFLKLIYFLFIVVSFYSSVQLKIHFHGNFSFNEAILHDGLLRYLDPVIFIKSIYFISLEIFKSFIKYPIWILATLILFFDTIFMKKFSNIYLIFFIIFLGFVYAIYLQTSMDIVQLMPLTLDRIIFQGSGFYLLYIVNFLNKNFNQKNF